MSFCPKCGNELMDMDKFCNKCGAELSPSNSDNQELVDKVEVSGQDEGNDKESNRREITQSRAAIVTAIGILLLVDLLALVAWASGEFDRPGIIFGSIAIDIFLGVYMLLGRNWARIWMLVRAIAGLVFVSIAFIAAGDFVTVSIQIGVCGAVILLLTGTSTRLRLAGSIALVVVAAFSAIALAIVAPFTAESELPTTPETPTPSSFMTYTSEGFYSISYPPDWEPEMSIIEDAEKDIKNWAKGEGLESISEMQLVFTGWKMTEDGDPPFVMVQVIPRGLWPLDTLVEADRQLSIETIGQYLEHSMVRTTIGGREAIVLNWQGCFPESTSLTRGTTAYIAGEEFLWAVTCACDDQDSDEYLDTFDDIVRSLRVEY